MCKHRCAGETVQFRHPSWRHRNVALINNHHKKPEACSIKLKSPSILDKNSKVGITFKNCGSCVLHIQFRERRTTAISLLPIGGADVQHCFTYEKIIKRGIKWMGQSHTSQTEVDQDDPSLLCFHLCRVPWVCSLLGPELLALQPQVPSFFFSPLVSFASQILYTPQAVYWLHLSTWKLATL